MISIREKSKELTMLATARDFAAGLGRVSWIEIAADNLSGKIIGLPKREDIQIPVNEQQIVELYSK